MNGSAATSEKVPKALSDQDVLSICRFGAAADEVLLNGSMEPFRQKRGVPPRAVIDSASATIPLAGWLRAILPAISEIETLENNWDTYGSPPPAKELLNEVLLLLYLTELDFPPPAVVPISGGGIQLEWLVGGRELEVEFRPSAQAVFLATDLRDRSSYEGIFYRTDYNAMRELIGWVTEA
ncbi:MAG: hypothetical protein MUP47_02440 [Phycisphaerae bacterium]|nr:hypothetical protein [Phycisphaerae bacterium]